MLPSEHFRIKLKKLHSNYIYFTLIKTWEGEISCVEVLNSLRDGKELSNALGLPTGTQTVKL